MPVGHATNNVHTFFTNATTVGTCGTLCKGLSITSGTASTSTVETSIAIGSAPAKDANTNAFKTGTWASGTSFTITGVSTTTAADTVIVFVVTSGTVAVSSISASGVTFDASAPTVTSTSATLNANDMVIGFEADQNSITQTAGTGFTLDLTVAGACCSLAVEHKTVSAIGTQTCAMATTDTRWDIFCDVLQSAVKYYKAEPQTSASLAGTPSTAANGFSGTGWVYNVAGIQSGLVDIQSGTWQIDLTGKVDSTTGTPVARYFVTAWSCTTSSCTTASFLWKNWDTATNVASSTTATLRTYITASQSQITWTSGNFLAFEVWVAWQYSSSTANRQMTETTISTAMDFITPGWDFAQSLSGSLTSATSLVEKSSLLRSLSGSLSLAGSETKGLAKALTGSLSFASSLTERNSRFRSVSGSLTLASGFTENTSLFRSMTGSLALASSFAEKSSVFKSLSGSLTLASSLAEKSSVFKAIAASITLTMGNMVANVNSGGLTCNSNPRSCSTTLAATWTITSGFAEKSSVLRSLSGSLSLAGSETKGLARSLTGSLSLASSFAEKSSLFRSVTGSLGLAGSQVKGLAKTLTGSLSFASSLTERNSLFRSLSGSLSLAGSETKGLAKTLSASIASMSTFTEHASLFRSFSGSLTLVSSETKGLAKTLSASIA